ncbi:hypothetical protein [Sediminibacterium soli]|uniref:hypothetical protein n=1 Tax=Sediminibacterium soli TaxID=2698829 RepID=UPI00137AAA43|nr:hypothetical protein [Sediminibacterium soli]NCI46583.1 hypothetical protein [Sediminibacterium soli]
MRLKKILFRKGFNNFITDIIERFQVTRDEVLQAVSHFGDFRAKVYTYFIVRAYQQRNGLRVEDVKESVVNRWFPS